MPRQKGGPAKLYLDGQKFHRLLVETRVAGSFWGCVCDCGNKLAVSSYQLKSGKTKSCGCYSKERTTTHGMEGTSTYNVWAHMLSRCRNKNHGQYKDYGGRGITVCKEWQRFEGFYADMGDKPEGLSIERKDNNAGYHKGNCEWATIKKQIRNRRISPRYEWNGEMKSLSELAEIHGMKWRKVYERMRCGWPLADALTIKKANAWSRGAR